MIIGVNNIVQSLRNVNMEHVRNAQSAKKGQDSSNEALRINLNNQEKQTEQQREIKKVEVKQSLTKAFFAVTEDENVVIKIVDEEGKLIRQIPPEEFMKMVEYLKKYNENLFSMEV